MNDLMFWEIIDNVKILAETNDERINILKHKLTNFTAEEIMFFRNIMKNILQPPILGFYMVLHI